MKDNPKKSDESEQTEIVVAKDEREVDDFVSEWGFHSTDDAAEFVPQT